MHKRLINLMACPKCKQKIKYEAATKMLICEHDQLAFPVRNGFPIMLESDAKQIAPQVNDIAKDLS